MACEDIELRLSGLKDDKRELEENLEMAPPHKKDLFEANLDRIKGEIQREEANLRDCRAAATAADQENLDTSGFVGTVEVETRSTARVWFGLTQSKDAGDWIKIGPVRAWFTLDLEASDRPFYLAELALLMEAMRGGDHVAVSHGGAITEFHRSDPNDSFAVDGVRLLRSPMLISA